MATSIGKIEPFDPRNGEDWTHYVERLEYYFLANGIQAAEKKRAVLISVMGPQAYKLLRTLISPSMPNDKSFSQLVDVLKNHYDPKPSEIIQRFHFNSRVRKHGESVATYLAELRALAQHCNFEASLEDMLRDRLVVGINDPALQQRLLAEPRLNLKKAAEISLAHETAAKDSKAIQGQGTNGALQAVNRVAGTKPRPTNSTKPCHRCGKSNHKATECYYKETTCSYCKKKGHLAKVCRSRPSTKPPLSTQRKQATHLVEMTEPDQEASEYSLFTINSCRDGQGTDSNLFTVNVIINKQPIGMQIDTGAAVSIMSEATYKQLGLQGNSPPIEALIKICE